MGGRERAKPMDMRTRFAREAVTGQNGHSRSIEIPTEFRPADLLTEGLHRRQLESCLCRLLGGEDPPWPGLRPLASVGGETTLGWISSWSHVGP